jgi:hypothetical protein
MARYEFNAQTGQSVELPDLPPEPVTAPSQYQLDVSRYTKRAAVKDRLLAEMAADNMARVRSGVWTVVDLTDLMADPDVKAVLEMIGTLSFELASQALAAADQPLLTPQIKAGWVAKLQAHLYLVP